jgi:serine/threonine protein kinase
VKLAFHVASGLKTLHDGGMMHRDLKLSNIFVTSSGIYKIGIIIIIIFKKCIYVYAMIGDYGTSHAIERRETMTKVGTKFCSKLLLCVHLIFL